MISFFRRFSNSKATAGLFALILLAFIVTGFGSPFGLESLAIGGDNVAKIGSSKLDAATVTANIQRGFESARAEKPELTMAQFVQSGQVEDDIDRMIIGQSIDVFAKGEGMVVSRRLVDRELAKISRFYGPTGKFDPSRFQAVLAESKLKEQDVRDQFARDQLGKIFEVTAGAAVGQPVQAGLAYAAVQLESRTGQVATIGLDQFKAGINPSAQEVSAFYAANPSRYLVPETRVVRYAVISSAAFAAAAPTEAEIAAAYKASAAKFATVERRTLTQAIVQDQNAAKALVAKAQAGAFADAVKAAGAVATTLKPLDKAGYGAIATSPAVADAAFAAKQGDVVLAGKSALGWHVVKVDQVAVTGGKTLDQARAELLPDLIKRKQADALLDHVAKIEEAVDGGQTFDEVVKSQGLSVVETPAVTASGVAPDNRAFVAAKELLPILKDAFQTEVDDEPMTVVIDPATGAHGFYDVVKVNGAAPRPLAALGDQVRQDLVADRAAKQARKVANAVLARVNKGATLSAALSAEKLGGASSIAGKRTDLSQGPDKLAAGMGTLFQLSRGKARMDTLPGGKGYIIVALDRVVPGDPRSNPQITNALMQQLSQSMGGELTRQFLTALGKDVGVSKDAARIAKLKASLTNPSGQ
jgi:peptidyl-prolyl cis-trans isomerase D